MEMKDYEEVWGEVMGLSVEDRLRLMEDLAATVPDDQPPRLSGEWLEEIERRGKEIEAGKVKTESWESVRQRSRKSVGWHDADGDSS